MSAPDNQLRNRLGHVGIDQIGHHRGVAADGCGQPCQPASSRIRARERVADDPVGLRLRSVRTQARDGDRHGHRPGGRASHGKGLGKALALGGGKQIARQMRLGQVMVAGKSFGRAPGNVSYAGILPAGKINRVPHLCGRGKMHHLANALAGEIGLDQQRDAFRVDMLLEFEAVAPYPHRRCAAGKALLAVVEPVRLEFSVVPLGRDGELPGVRQPSADLEGHNRAAGRGSADQRARGNRIADDIALNGGAGRKRGRGLVVHQPRHAHERAALGGVQQRRLGGHTVLQIAQLVGHGAEGFHEHYAEVGLGALLP